MKNETKKNNHINWFFLLLSGLIFLYSFLSAFPVYATEVVVIRESEIKPYSNAIEGFKSVCNCSVKELELANGVIEKVAKNRPDAVFAVGTKAFRKARTIKDIPVIYSMVMPSELAGLSMQNTYGVSMDVSPRESLGTIINLFPGVRRIGLLSDPRQTGHFAEEAAAVARPLGVVLVIKTVRNAQQVPELLDEMRNQIDVFWMLPDTTVLNADTINYLMLFSFQNNLPIFSFSRKYVELGAAAALSIDPFSMGQKAAEIARQLSKGERQPFETYAEARRLTVNMKIASKIGIKFNNDIIRNAEKLE